MSTSSVGITASVVHLRLWLYCSLKEMNSLASILILGIVGLDFRGDIFICLYTLSVNLLHPKVMTLNDFLATLFSSNHFL